MLRPLAGLALCAVLAVTAMQLERLSWLADHGLGALTIAIVLGIVVGNLVHENRMSPFSSGVTLSKQTLLRLGIILYGFRLTFHDISAIGITGVATDLVTLTTTFLLCGWIGTRLLGLDRTTALLIGTGSSICGAAAVIAAAPVLKARAEQVTVAVATVVVFGTAATFLYPFIYSVVQHLLPGLLSDRSYGLYVGSTIHEVAQVVAAGRAVSEQAATTAVIEKMVRVMLLAPFLVLLSAWLSTDQTTRDEGASRGRLPIVIPWFAVVFVLVAAFNSFVQMPLAASSMILHFDTLLLAMAMAALGLTTHRVALTNAGPKPLLLGAAMFGWLVIGGGLINLAASRFGF